MEKRSLPDSLVERLSPEEIEVLKSLESNKNSKSIPKEYVKEAAENRPTNQAEGLSDLDEYDMECEVITDNPAGEMKEAKPECTKIEIPHLTEEQREEKELLSEMSSMINPKAEEEEEKEIPVSERVNIVEEEKKQKPQMFLVRKIKPSQAMQDDPNLTEEEKHKLLLEKML